MDDETLNESNGAENAVQSVYEPEIRRAVCVMQSSLSDPWSIDQLAKCAGMSKSQFMMHFRAVTSQTPMQCLRSMRMERACELLANGRTSIQEVANQVGYSSASAFSDVFNRHTGTAPGTYRRKELQVPRIKFAQRFRTCFKNQIVRPTSNEMPCLTGC